ncbi:malto-oligosyltrehalose trehalohydrolase [Labilithrix luteola]|uniref:malto-oligosyltrehalose trehalohydrolase n=1 Tax=Labilithrix luteola TaxID=1391654 RepID=UPI0011BA7CA3
MSIQGTDDRGLGARLEAGGTTFTVWATRAKRVEVRFFDEARRVLRTERLEPQADHVFVGHFGDVREGALYLFVLDGVETPDPYARALPFGVHGPARVVADAREPALRHVHPLHAWVIYELHVGTFTTEGTFRSAIEKLDDLVELGIDVVELMPVAAFAGERGWGYDGVALFAVHPAYGTPDDLRELVRAAHERGIAVLLDVVYNHFGPSGNYLARYAPEYFSTKVTTPWGVAPNFENPRMRGLVVQNARYWLEEFGIDGLRLDATHSIHDDSTRHVLHELTSVAHEMAPRRAVFFEDARNDPAMFGELGADGIWADDFHHQLHVVLTGERDGYYAAYERGLPDLARTIAQGWLFQGEPYAAAPWKGRPRGKPSSGVPPEALVYCLQNHDQIGNRAFGDRLAGPDGLDLDTYCAVATLLLFLPMTPLLFMGEEWAATTPFLFFSHLDGDLGRHVSEGRRREFASFEAFADRAVARTIPDPQEETTFTRSKLDWSERMSPPHARVLDVYRTMLSLRRSDPVLRVRCNLGEVSARAEGNVLVVHRRTPLDSRTIYVNFGREDARLPAGARTLFATSKTAEERVPGRSAVIVDP